MRELVLHLIDERGPIRLVIELAIGLGSLAVVASWAHERFLRRRRDGRAAAADAPTSARRAA